MSRCDCGTRCTCVITAGDGIAVDGNGSTAAPYVISATGDGTVSCDQVRPCISAGDGLAYDVATGVMEARPSTDAGNTLEIGTDGGLMVPPGGSTALQVTDTPSIDLTLSGSGTTGDPYNVTAVVKLDATPPGGGSNLMHEGPDGLYVECADVRSCLSEGDGIDYDATTGVISARPSTNAGNQLEIGSDGGLMVPALVTDCGLTGDGSAGAPLAAAVQAWPYPCDVDANAGSVYCDSTGALRGEPPSRATFVQDSLNETGLSIPVPTGSNNVIETRTLTIVNPDPCREAFVIAEVEVDIDFDLPGSSGGAYGIQTDEMAYFANRGSTTAFDVHCQTTKVYNRVIPPGGVLNEPLNITLARGSGGATVNRIQSFMRAFVFNM
ncbi:hypothetical protein [Planotetraspora sp. GP83]|uniref:hypothetical protein n=1 Tax=Planotetraspora sp. GP83 TaxID=3156264 RepID=UPI003518FD51